MHQFGWSQSGFFDSKADEIALYHCVARYHAYVENGGLDRASYRLHSRQVPRFNGLSTDHLLGADLGH